MHDGRRLIQDLNFSTRRFRRLRTKIVIKLYPNARFDAFEMLAYCLKCLINI